MNLNSLSDTQLLEATKTLVALKHWDPGSENQCCASEAETSKSETPESEKTVVEATEIPVAKTQAAIRDLGGAGDKSATKTIGEFGSAAKSCSSEPNSPWLSRKASGKGGQRAIGRKRPPSEIAVATSLPKVETEVLPRRTKCRSPETKRPDRVP